MPDGLLVMINSNKHLCRTTQHLQNDMLSIQELLLNQSSQKSKVKNTIFSFSVERQTRDGSSTSISVC